MGTCSGREVGAAGEFSIGVTGAIDHGHELGPTEPHGGCSHHVESARGVVQHDVGGVSFQLFRRCPSSPLHNRLG